MHRHHSSFEVLVVLDHLHSDHTISTLRQMLSTVSEAVSLQRTKAKFLGLCNFISAKQKVIDMAASDAMQSQSIII